MEDVNKQYQDVSVELSLVTARLDEAIQPISIRQMATNANNAAIEAIFPKRRQKPHCVRSYSNLLSFLLKPESDEFTGPFAPQAWLELSDDDRLAIKSRAGQLANSYPYLKVSIFLRLLKKKRGSRPIVPRLLKKRCFFPAERR